VDSPGIVGKVEATGTQNTIFLALKLETVQVPVLPAYYYLEDLMQLSPGGVAPCQHAPADCPSLLDALHYHAPYRY